MLFKDYHIPQIRSGSKTVTRREWDEDYAGPNVGSVHIAADEMFVPDEEADCYIRILDVYEQPLGEMTDEDARAEGDYESLDEFREGYEDVYGEGAWDPEKVVDVVEFEYVGRERPDSEGGDEQRDPTDDPRACSRCGVHIGLSEDDYCDPCARDIGAKPPMQRCMGCGRDAPQEEMETVDLSGPDDYYPEIDYLCRACSGDTDSPDSEPTGGDGADA